MISLIKGILSPKLLKSGNDMRGKFEIGQKVKFTDAALRQMTGDEHVRFNGREGEIAGYRLGARDPIVVFPKRGRFKEIKLFEVPRSKLVEVFSIDRAPKEYK